MNYLIISKESDICPMTIVNGCCNYNGTKVAKSIDV